MTAPVPARLGVHAEAGHPVWKVLADLGEFFTVVAGPDQDIDAAFVVDGGEAAAERVEELLGSGVSVLVQPPWGSRAVTSALRTARRAGAHFALLDLAEAVGPLAEVVSERIGRGDVAEVELVTSPAGLHTALRVLHGLLPSLRPWRLVARAPELLAGTVGTTTVTLVVRTEGGTADLVPDRIAVRGAAGTVLASPDGLTWLPGPFGGRPEAVSRRPDLGSVLHRQLTALHTSVGERTGARDVAAAQLGLTVSRLADDVTDSLTAAEHPRFPAGLADEAHRAGLAHVTDPEPAVAAGKEAERIALATMARVLADACADGRARTVEEILSEARVAPGTAWLVRRWLAVLVEEGVFELDGGRVRPVPTIPTASAEADLEPVYSALGFPATVGRFHSRVRSRLPELVRGEVALSSLLFPGGDTGIAEALYGEGWASRYLNAAAARAVVTALRGVDGTATVLELGAGVGATTRVVLSELDTAGFDEVRYVYSDISRLFLVAAARWDAHRHRVRPALLDVNDDLLAQGAPSASADVVIAGHVLHSAVDLGRTLRSVRATLRRGGTLVVVESTVENYALLASIQLLRSADETAPLPGSADGRARKGRMFPDLDGWRSALASAGFTVQACLPPADHPGAGLGQALIVATAT
ncbi:class I SAM-dependent methyltransferase [Saccharomonospora cyanea]|uniref:Methylase involved in ubiquinone/menaquinone biosynthesis n=1 Tax=Saccharomonospora cyanea NA-134 TaxID=882082 RepID=H5XHI8_9PSEU|nr:methyltransferase [Saccharomonospora cyanea]EHR61668.1 methylase involved in ubiquinone/menaquinone biosynthesis [Saccharomonospora cyanea NA-134]